MRMCERARGGGRRERSRDEGSRGFHEEGEKFRERESKSVELEMKNEANRFFFLSFYIKSCEPAQLNQTG